MVRGNFDNGLTGAGWVVIRGGWEWTQAGNTLFGGSLVRAADQGWCVALSGNGNITIVGRLNDDGRPVLLKRRDKNAVGASALPCRP